MTDFEQKKEEYFKKLKSNPDIVNKIIFDNKDSEKGQKTLEIMFTPKNERELAAAEILYSMTTDIIKLLEKYYDDELEEIPLNENKGLKEYIKVIKGLKEGKEEVSLIPKDASPREIAEIVYGFINALLFNENQILEYIGQETGFDLTDDFESKQLQVYFNKAKRIIDSRSSAEKDLNDCTEKEIEDAIEIAKEFHKICEEAKKDLGNETKEEQISRKLTGQLVKAFDESRKKDS